MKTLDTIINDDKTNYYIKDYASPAPILPLYNRIIETTIQLYDAMKFTAEFTYNMVMRK